MRRIAIVGLGLMGGSLGLALRKHGYAGRLAGYTRQADRRAAALECGAVDEIFDSPAAAVRGADLVVYGAPIRQIPGLVRDTVGALSPGAILTDVGSTKAYLASEIEPVARAAGVHWVGSHPIAGSERQGIGAARADLYEGATVVVTVGGDVPAEITRSVEQVWCQVGARVVRMDAAAHDRMLARTSHLPHLAAALVVAAVGREGTDPVSGFCGAGFRDTTRVAEGAPEIWMDILSTNRDAILEELRALSVSTRAMLELLEQRDFDRLENMLESARLSRRSIVRAAVEMRASGESE